MRAVLLAALALLAGCGHGRLRLAPGEEGEVIETEGWAPLDAADRLGAKRRALADAQKKAVERVAGVFISAKTRVDQGVEIDQRILANVLGYVRKYDVLDEREEDGFLKTRIRAVVLYKKIGDDLKALGLDRPAPPPGNPRMAVVVRQGAPAAESLRAVLLSRGFSVVDPLNAAGSDLLFQGEAVVHPVEDARLAGLHSARARLTISVSRSKTSEVVASRSQEASGLDVAAEVAAQKALAKAGSLLGEALVKDLAPALKSQLGVVVKIAGLEGFEQVRRLVDDIRMNPEVAAVSLSDYHPGEAELQVTTDGVPGEDLSAMILRSPKFRLTAVSVSAYEVRLKAP